MTSWLGYTEYRIRHEQAWGILKIVIQADVTIILIHLVCEGKCVQMAMAVITYSLWIADQTDCYGTKDSIYMMTRI